MDELGIQRKMAIISMSGGLDSATLCAEALHQGFNVYIVNFNYGQKNIVELEAFKNLIKHFKSRDDLKGKIIGVKQLDLTSMLNEFTSIWQDLRDQKKIEEKSKHEFYTPSRNLLFAVLSAVIGEIIALNKDYYEVNIGLGIHKHSEEAYGEHKDYWDITPEFAKRLGDLFRLNDVVDLNVFAPFVDKTKTAVVKRAIELNVPYLKTWTCYNPVEIRRGVYVACNKCEACTERMLAGIKAGVKDINHYCIEIKD